MRRFENTKHNQHFDNLIPCSCESVLVEEQRRLLKKSRAIKLAPYIENYTLFRRFVS